MKVAETAKGVVLYNTKRHIFAILVVTTVIVDVESPS
jgi:hypothetical protein